MGTPFPAILGSKLPRCGPEGLRGKALAGVVLVGAAYIAACVLWTPALWLLPTAIALGVWIFGKVGV